MALPIQATVLGGGSFGTAIANAMAVNGFKVKLWVRNPEQAMAIESSRENQQYLPGYPLHDGLMALSDMKEAVCDSQIVFISVPSSAFREVSANLSKHLSSPVMLVSTTKGISQIKEQGQSNTQQNFVLMSEIIQEELPGMPYGVLSGPNFAREIIQQQLTGTVVASESEALVDTVQSLLRSEKMRVYSSHDYYGVELAGALKNIYAIIAGMADARKYGHNTMALLITRALAEMGRFAHELGADPMTFLGLSGVGDLILTCGSDLSRNYRVGFSMGDGKSLTAAMRESGQVVEGVNTLRIVKEQADNLGVPMPLVNALYALLFDGAAPDSIIRQLMLSDQNSDVDFTGAIR